MAARRARPAGHVLATDISASMLEIAVESAGHDGLTNLRTRVADAEHLDLTSDSFDAAISRNCLMLIPDYRRALAEIRRVLKPSGRVAAIVYSTPDRCPYLAIPHAIAYRLGRLTSPPLEEFGEFRLSAPGRLQDAFSSAGFRDVTVHTVPTRRRFPSLSDAMRYARGPPAGRTLAPLTLPVPKASSAQVGVASPPPGAPTRRPPSGPRTGSSPGTFPRSSATSSWPRSSPR